MDLGSFVDDLKANCEGFDRMIERVPDGGPPPEQNKFMAGQFLASDMRLSSEGVTCWAQHEKLILTRGIARLRLSLGLSLTIATSHSPVSRLLRIPRMLSSR